MHFSSEKKKVLKEPLKTFSISGFHLLLDCKTIEIIIGLSFPNFKDVF